MAVFWKKKVWFVHGQDQNSKKTEKKNVAFHNHLHGLAMLPLCCMMLAIGVLHFSNLFTRSKQIHSYSTRSAINSWNFPRRNVERKPVIISSLELVRKYGMVSCLNFGSSGKHTSIVDWTTCFWSFLKLRRWSWMLICAWLIFQKYMAFL